MGTAPTLPRDWSLLVKAMPGPTRVLTRVTAAYRSTGTGNKQGSMLETTLCPNLFLIEFRLAWVDQSNYARGNICNGSILRCTGQAAARPSCQGVCICLLTCGGAGPDGSYTGAAGPRRRGLGGLPTGPMLADLIMGRSGCSLPVAAFHRAAARDSPGEYSVVQHSAAQRVRRQSARGAVGNWAAADILCRHPVQTSHDG
jgi:hypothetical protein